MKKIELLAPAGSREKLQMAIMYGADAVYLAGKSFGLRAFSDNFTDEELREAVSFVHAHGKKAYITVNIFAHNEDLKALPEYIEYVSDIKADAVIVSDPGVYRIVRQVAPELPIHISTQANTTNRSAVKFWEEAGGVSRVVMAREVSLTDIADISQSTSLELEAFVHGAMCISYSGRCLLSNYFTVTRDGNRGECTQACRWKYSLMEETRPGQYFPVAEDERGTYIFNSKDLCLLPFLPQLAKAGIGSLKIEGRMKSVHYAATVVKVYRQALDAMYALGDEYAVRDEWWDELAKISHRTYTTGFYFGKPTQKDHIYSGRTNMQTHDFIGLVQEYDPVRRTAVIEQRNNFKLGDEVEFFSPHGENFSQCLDMMLDSEGNDIAVAPHAQQLVTVAMQKPIEKYSLVRRKIV